MTKILTVDDDKGTTALIEAILLSEGYESTIVNESHEAMEAAKRINPDLIILDLMMPEPTGFQLCRMLRASPDFVTTPIIIVTALSDEDSRVVAMGAGANDYLTKPFKVGDLVQKIRDLIS